MNASDPVDEEDERPCYHVYGRCLYCDRADDDGCEWEERREKNK